MKKHVLASMTMFFAFFVAAQDSTAVQGHKNNNNFKQLYEEFAYPQPI
jgi:hypothetical protein